MTWVIVKDAWGNEFDQEVDCLNPMVGDRLWNGTTIVAVMEDDDDDFQALELLDDEEGYE